MYFIAFELGFLEQLRTPITVSGFLEGYALLNDSPVPSGKGKSFFFLLVKKSESVNAKSERRRFVWLLNGSPLRCDVDDDLRQAGERKCADARRCGCRGAAARSRPMLREEISAELDVSMDQRRRFVARMIAIQRVQRIIPIHVGESCE